MADGVEEPQSRDWTAALVLGCCVALFAWLSGNSDTFPPGLWDDVAVAAGLRPPSSPFPGLWRCAASLLFAKAGIERGLKVLLFLGPVSLGVLAALAYRIFVELLPRTLRFGMRRARWGRAIVASMLAQGALLFVMADPVWKAGRALSPTMAVMLPAVASVLMLLRAARRESPRMAVAMSAIQGLLAADTPLAFLGPFVFAAVSKMRSVSASSKAGGAEIGNPFVRHFMFHRMAAAFGLACAAGVAANTWSFMDGGGLEALEWDGGTYAMRYLRGLAAAVAFAASPLGWAFVSAAVAVPLCLAAAKVRGATDNEKFLSYVSGLFFFVAGALALLQSCGWRTFWFWRWAGDAVTVRSELLLCACLLCTALMFVLSLGVLGVEVYFRNYRRIAMTRYEDDVEGSPTAARTVKSFRFVGRWARTALLCEPLAVLALVVPCKLSPLERDMAAVVNDAAMQTADECEGARLLFTDGSMDAAVEVAAAMRGRGLKALSMMSGSSPLERYVRRRGEDDAEDAAMLDTGASNALRTWVRKKPERATNIAVQVGFELWRHDRLPMPECGGLVARTGGFAPGAAEKWTSRAHALAMRVLDVCGEGDPGAAPDAAVRSLFTFVQWRLSRMCRMRADAADAAGDAALSMSETELADALDEKNAAYARVRRQMDWVGLQRNSRITPREGLEMWLDRADFRMAQVYARAILQADPGDPRANFAMGMCHYVEGQYNRAEIYLKRSLERRPDEPATLNNLAVVLVEAGRLEEAEAYAAKALEKRPDSAEIKATLRHIRSLQER